MALLTLLTAALADAPAHAGPLEEALATAYMESPALEAGRAALRAADEGVPLARAGERPSLTARSYAGVALTDGDGGMATPTRQSLTLSQSLSSGGATVAAVREAERVVEAERARLLQLEQQVLLETVAAFTAVARDQALAERARENRKRLKNQLDATRDRIRLGALTKTDLAQAESRLAGAEALVTASEGALAESTAELVRLLGHAPDTVEMPEPPEEIAETLEGALAAAQGSFVYQEAEAELAAADAAIQGARSAFRPKLALSGEVTYADEPQVLQESRTNASVGAVLQIPLYAGGGEWARLRRAKEMRRERRSTLDDVERRATASITAAWQARRTAAARIRSLQVQADAAAFALDGVRQEALVGSRTVLDILDAEEELLDAETDLIRARREEVVAAYRLRAVMGRMTAQALGLGVEIHDPLLHYRDVRKRWFGDAKSGTSP